MGILIWLHKRRAKAITRSMLKQYALCKALHPELDDIALCRGVICLRYQQIFPSPKEEAIISSSITTVETISQACLLVTRAETDISICKDNPLWVAIITAVASETATSLKSQKDINTTVSNLIMFAYAIEDRKEKDEPL